jgi:GNAT superfamily N-acetyltransferase
LAGIGVFEGNVMEDDLEIRFANRNDIHLIFDFVKELAEYENLLDDVTATEELLFENLFLNRNVEAIIVEIGKKPVGFAVFHPSFSSFLGKPNIYIEDLFIKENYRRKGVGKSLLSFIAKIALERGCGRVEWSALDWNTDAINFYKSLGAKPVDDLKIFRLAGSDLENCGNSGS